MKPTPLSSVLADDLLLDRVGARLDIDDELGSLLLSVARHVDAPITHPALRARRGGRRRGLVVLAALGVAVSGATVAAALETAPGLPATTGNPAHTRLLPQALQALGLPFTGSGLVQGRLLLPGGPGLLGVTGPIGLTSGPGTIVAAGAPSVTGLPTLVLMRSADDADGVGGAGGAGGADAAHAGAGDGRASDPVVTSHSASSPAGDQQQSATDVNGSSRPTASQGQDATEGDEQAGAPTGVPSGSPTNSAGNAFPATGNAGQRAHAATLSPEPMSRTTPPTPTRTMSRAIDGGIVAGDTGTLLTPTTIRSRAPASPVAAATPATSPTTPANGRSVATSAANGAASAAAKARPADPTTSSTPTPSPTRSASPTAVPPPARSRGEGARRSP